MHFRPAKGTYFRPAKGTYSRPARRETRQGYVLLYLDKPGDGILVL